MFAYCENNGIIRYDTTGEWFYSIENYNERFIKPIEETLNRLRNNSSKNRQSYEIYKGYKSYYNTVISKRKRIESRYIENKKILGYYSNYIFGQDNYPVRKMKYGDSESEIRKVGCELIAIYNTMKYIGVYQSFARVILLAELNGYPWLKGIFGTDPKIIGSYFSAYNVHYTRCRNMKSFKKEIKNSKFSILSINNSDGITIHTFCIRYVKSKNRYYSYNFYSDDNSPKLFNFSKIANRKFIVGYCFK